MQEVAVTRLRPQERHEEKLSSVNHLLIYLTSVKRTQDRTLVVIIIVRSDAIARRPQKNFELTQPSHNMNMRNKSVRVAVYLAASPPRNPCSAIRLEISKQSWYQM